MELKNIKSPQININFSSDYSSYSIYLDNSLWLESGYIGYRQQNQWIECNKSNLNSIKNITNGIDNYGNYNEMILYYNNNTYGIHFLYYLNNPNIILFAQSFPFGLTNTANSNKDDIITSFPSFKIYSNNTKTKPINIGYYHFAGNQATSLGSQSGEWNSELGELALHGGIEGSGPLALFDKDLNNTLIISSLTNPMIINQYIDKQKHEIQYGMQGLINNINVNFNIKYIMIAVSSGINTAMKEWGSKQLSWFNKDHSNDYGHARDLTLQYLGYSTDNGAYYYYWTETNKTYQQTLLDVKQYHNSMNIPTKYILIDSWWYYHGWNGGLLNWTAPPSIFPNGIEYIYKETGWKIQAHSKFFSTNTVYANNLIPQNETNNNTNYNGTRFPFTNGLQNKSIPITLEFWNYLFDINDNWGLINYEQDWIEQTSENMALILNDTLFGQEWLNQMNTAAYSHNLCIQYCSAYPRHLMASIQSLQSVTQTRASGDYHPPSAQQWQIGVSSIFVISLNLSPSKDSYWTTTTPQNSKYGKHTVAKAVELQSAVLSLSNGPVAFSDQIGYSNRSLIMKCCNSDGLILRPDISATMIDKYFINIINNITIGEIWTTTSMINNEYYRYFYILGAVIPRNYDFYLSDLFYQFSYNSDVVNTWLAFNFRESSKFVIFNETNSLILNECYLDDFYLYTLIPIQSIKDNLWYLQGEIDKWISVSKLRFIDINMDFDDGITQITITGAVNETVNVGFINPSTMKQIIVDCLITETQKTIIQMPGSLCL